MQRAKLHIRTLLYYWRTNSALMLGSIVATAALTGALFVGDSMRASLRSVALSRLGPVDHALLSTRFISEDLAAGLTGAIGHKPSSISVPVIILNGSIRHADMQSRADNVTIYGVDHRYWNSEQTSSAAPDLIADSDDRSVLLNATLAAELGVNPRDEVIVQVASTGGVSVETILGRRDRPGVTLRLRVTTTTPNFGLGGLSLNPTFRSPRNVFISLATLQRALKQQGRVNAALVIGEDGNPTPSIEVGAVQRAFNERASLESLGLRLRVDEARGYVAVESEQFLLEPAVERAARTAAAAIGANCIGILTYLANSIEVLEDGGADSKTNDARTGAAVPYSTVAALEDFSILSEVVTVPSDIHGTSIFLNEWAAAALNAKPGDAIRLTYYLTGEFGRIETKRADFELAGIVRLEGAAADRGFTPEYPGVTDTDSITSWDPPFPVDLSLVRDEDERYWKQHRATPKAFVPLGAGQTLWAEDAERFGKVTSVRVHPKESQSVHELADTLRPLIRANFNVADLGLRFEPVRERAVAGSGGTNDFGVLFLSFSAFLIMAAAMLVALLFRLQIEHRSREVGLLRAVGFSGAQAIVTLAAQAAIVAAVGGVAGIAFAIIYARLMLMGLGSWWSAAVNAPYLTLHATPTSAVIGSLVGFVMALGAVVLTMVGLRRWSPASLLAGAAREASIVTVTRRKKWPAVIIALGIIGAAAFVVAGSLGSSRQTAAMFFGSGAALLTVTMLLIRHYVLAIHVAGPKRWRIGLIGLSLRNASRRPGRSTLTVGVIACTTFLISALQAFRLDIDGRDTDQLRGLGGFALLAESSAPIPFDLNTPEGREATNLDAAFAAAWSTIMPFRLRPGDETSCLNLYQPTRPRILGTTQGMIARGGFQFAGTQADNPWRRLNDTLPDGVIPAIGDENAVKWQLHSGVGNDLVVQDERGRDVRLRFVALLRGSALQSEILISEENFTRLFPSLSGYSFFLIELSETAESAAVGTNMKPGDAARRSRVGSGESKDGLRLVSDELERALQTYGFDVSSLTDRLTGYSAVQNTYLSTFQTLGGLGLVLGMFGLAAVMLRNVWERRAELALLRAVGYTRRAIAGIVFLENAILVTLGLAAGALPAAVAVAPHLIERPAALPLGSLAVLLTAVLLAGLAAGAMAIIPTLRAPIIESLRAE